MPMVWVVLLSEMVLLALVLATVMVAVLPAPEAAVPLSQLTPVAQNEVPDDSLVHVPSAACVLKVKQRGASALKMSLISREPSAPDLV
jgi:hypothetical protein